MYPKGSCQFDSVHYFKRIPIIFSIPGPMLFVHSKAWLLAPALIFSLLFNDRRTGRQQGREVEREGGILFAPCVRSEARWQPLGLQSHTASTQPSPPRQRRPPITAARAAAAATPPPAPAQDGQGLGVRQRGGQRAEVQLHGPHPGDLHPEVEPRPLGAPRPQWRLGQRTESVSAVGGHGCVVRQSIRRSLAQGRKRPVGFQPLCLFPVFDAVGIE